MRRTVSIPVDLPSDRFLPLLAECAEVFNRHVAWALAARTYSKAKAHQALYAEQRSAHPAVPSALIQTVRDTALEAIKATAFEKRPRKEPTSGLRYDRRTFTLRGAQITLSCIGSRVRAVLPVPEYFRAIYDTWACKSAMLTYARGSKQFWIRLVFAAPDPPREEGASAEAATIGIDRGLYHLAVTSTGQTYANRRVRAVQRRYLHFALFLTYKAEALGKRVVYVDPRYTSQTCARCKRRSSAYRHKARFRCGSCGYRDHADRNAANNIRDDYLLSSTPQAPEEQAVSTVPHVSPLGQCVERAGTSRTPRGCGR